MLKRFLCWFFGHKTVYKVFTGQTVVIDGYLDRNIVTPVYRWERNKYCLRCGTPVHED